MDILPAAPEPQRPALDVITGIALVVATRRFRLHVHPCDRVYVAHAVSHFGLVLCRDVTVVDDFTVHPGLAFAEPRIPALVQPPDRIAA
jgi:hypothetical protein